MATAICRGPKNSRITAAQTARWVESRHYHGPRECPFPGVNLPLKAAIARKIIVPDIALRQSQFGPTDPSNVSDVNNLYMLTNVAPVSSVAPPRKSSSRT